MISATAENEVMTNLRIVVDHHASDSAKHIVQSGVDLHNVAATGLAEYYPVAMFLKNENDEVLGGVLGDIWGAWFHVSFLWVAEPLRGQGYGTKLLRMAEEHAVSRGCANVCLETHSFQAPRFYEKNGYEVFGRLADFPPGHAKYFLRKRLA